jgi:hypothetical protein
VVCFGKNSAAPLAEQQMSGNATNRECLIACDSIGAMRKGQVLLLLGILPLLAQGSRGQALYGAVHFDGGTNKKTPRLLPPFQPASTSIPQYSQYWLPSLPCPFKFSRLDCLTTEYRVTTEHLLSFVPECPSSVVMDGRFTATGSGSGYRHCLRLETGGALADLEAM